jgi:hypothetical protein
MRRNETGTPGSGGSPAILRVGLKFHQGDSAFSASYRQIRIEIEGDPEGVLDLMKLVREHLAEGWRED